MFGIDSVFELMRWEGSPFLPNGTKAATALAVCEERVASLATANPIELNS